MLTIVLAVLFDDRDAYAGGQLAYRRRKVDVLILHHEPEDAPADSAAKTVKCLPLRANGEGRCFFLMERTERFEIGAGTFQREVRANYLNNVVCRCDLLDCLRRNGHLLLVLGVVPNLACEELHPNEQQDS